MEQREIVLRRDSELVDKSMSVLESLMKDCPDPTNADLKKLLAVQGTVLHHLGIQLLESAASKRKIDGRVKLALNVIDASLRAVEAASKIE